MSGTELAENNEPNLDELQDSDEKRRRKGAGYWLTVFLLTLLALFLVLLFWPTGDMPLDAEVKKQPGTLKSSLSGAITVGDAEYQIQGYNTHLRIGKRKASRGVVYLVVKLKVRNKSTEPRSLQYSMIRLLLWRNGKEVPAHRMLSEMLHHDAGNISPWGQWIKSGKSVNTRAVFVIPLADNKLNLRLYSFDWTSKDFKEVPIAGLGELIEKTKKEIEELKRLKRQKAKDPDGEL